MEKTKKRLKIKAFGIARQILGGREITFETSARSVDELKQQLEVEYAELRTLKSFFIAVNNTYAADGTPVEEMDEIALIPPVSGG